MIITTSSEWIQVRVFFFAGADPIDNNNGWETINEDMKNIRVICDKQKIGSLIINDLTIQKVGPLKTTQGSIIVMGI